MIRGSALAALSLLLAGAAQAQGLSVLKGHDSNAPIDVTSDSIEVQDRADRAIFVGSVHVVQADMTMDAARMTVAYAQGATPGANPQIQRIDASGGVTVVNPGQRAKGDFGIYDLNRKLVTLIGHVTLVRDTNTVNGARLVIDMNTGRATVDGNAVGGGGGAATRGGRVTGRFTVPQKTQTTTPATAAATPADPAKK